MKFLRKRVEIKRYELIAIALIVLAICNIVGTFCDAVCVDRIDLEGGNYQLQSARYDESTSVDVYTFSNGINTATVKYGSGIGGKRGTTRLALSNACIRILRQPEGTNFAAISGTEGVMSDGTHVTVSKNDPICRVCVHLPTCSALKTVDLDGENVTAVVYFVAILDTTALMQMAGWLLLVIFTVLVWARFFFLDCKRVQECTAKPLA